MFIARAKQKETCRVLFETSFIRQNNIKEFTQSQEGKRKTTTEYLIYENNRKIVTEETLKENHTFVLGILQTNHKIHKLQHFCRSDKQIQIS